jgi:hypothetical protein
VNYFTWFCSAVYRRPGSETFHKERRDGYFISVFNFGLIDASLSGPNWDQTTSRDHYQGKGKWLYEPASDDSELCPGDDWSRYLCDSCKKYVTPFSDDHGELVCPYCDVHGGTWVKVMSAASDDGNRRLHQPPGTGGQYGRELNPLKTETENFPGVNSPPIGSPSRSVRPGPRFDCWPGWPGVFAGCPWVTVMPVEAE